MPYKDKEKAKEAQKIAQRKRMLNLSYRKKQAEYQKAWRIKKGLTKKLYCGICKKEIINKFKEHQFKFHKECQIIARREYDRKYQNRKRGKSGEIEEGILYGYKEPLKPVKDGFGYYGTLRYSIDKDRVQCHECGEYFKSIGSAHIRIHGMKTVNEYKEKYQLAQKTRLIGEGLRERFIEISTTPEGKKRVERISKYIGDKKLNEKARQKNIGRKNRLETRNIRDNCPDQLLDKIKNTPKTKNGTVKIAEFIRTYKNGSGLMWTINHTFGSWKKAVELAGLKPYNRTESEHTDQELLDYLRRFYDMYGRTAVNSDFSRGFLPSLKVYYNRFNSINEARILAKVPIIIQVGGYKWKEVPYKEYIKHSI